MTPRIVEPTAPVAPTTATLTSCTLGRWSPATSSGSTESAPSSNAVCSSRTAVSTCSSRTTHEILIGEVEIISMFTLGVAEHGKRLGGHARVALHSRAD